MAVHLPPDAHERLRERGATKEEVIAMAQQGERSPARFGHAGFRRNFSFDSIWRRRS